MDIDDRIDQCLSYLHEEGNNMVFGIDLYRDDEEHYMANVPHGLDQLMLEYNLINRPSGDRRMLTAFGREVIKVGGWKKYQKIQRKKVHEESLSKSEIEQLTKKQLELSIREMQVNFTQIKYWFWIWLTSMVVSAALGAWLQSLFKNS
jgi:hypothetical protein